MPTTAPPFELPAKLEVADGVKDPLFGMLVWLISTDRYGTLSRDRMDAELRATGRGRGTRIPYAWIRSLTRLPVEPGRTGRVRLELEGDLDVPLPYSILGYNPGRVVASPVCVFKEWSLGSLVFRAGTDREVVLDDVHLFGLEDGHVVVDVDAWLDWFLGKNLDDTNVTFLMLARHQGRWLGFGMGYSTHEANQGRSGIMDFRLDRIRFPTPRLMSGIAPGMRVYGEHLAEQWREPRLVLAGGPPPP